MMESIKRKGKEYIGSIPKRFIQLWFKFACAVFLYFAMNRVLGITYSAERTILAFTSWTSIGNSNWYITAILGLYICFFVAFSIGLRINEKETGRRISLVLLFAGAVIFMYIQMKLNRPMYCYNTIIIFPLGAIYSELREKIERFILKNEIRYFLVLTVMLMVYVLSFSRRWSHGLPMFSVWITAFIALLLLVTMKVNIHNNLLEWFGKHVFSIYILQRIPMILLNHLGYIERHKYMGLLLAFVSTIPLALIFEKATDRVINLIDNRRIKSGR